MLSAKCTHTLTQVRYAKRSRDVRSAVGPDWRLHCLMREKLRSRSGDTLSQSEDEIRVAGLIAIKMNLDISQVRV